MIKENSSDSARKPIHTFQTRQFLIFLNMDHKEAQTLIPCKSVSQCELLTAFDIRGSRNLALILKLNSEDLPLFVSFPVVFT